MSTANHLYIATNGKNPNKFTRVHVFGDESMYKRVVSGFRLAGKIADYLRANSLKWEEVRSGWNGFGYTDLDRYILVKAKDAKVVMALLDQKASAPKQQKSDPKEAWCRRLVRLTGISMEIAHQIAQEKLMAQDKQIRELECRQEERGYSVRRERLIEKIRRENPLRRIKDSDHARNILRASVRHNYSDYDNQLEVAHDLAFWGDIDPSLTKEYARAHTTYTNDISVFFEDDEE